MTWKPKKQYKESMKQKIGSLKRLTRSTNVSQNDKTEQGKHQNLINQRRKENITITASKILRIIRR
jgi:hypothetical protein